MLYLFDIHTSSFIMYLFNFFCFFLNQVISVEFWMFILYYCYKLFTRYKICKSFLPVCSFSFHPINRVFYRENVFNFDEVEFFLIFYGSLICIKIYLYNWVSQMFPFMFLSRSFFIILCRYCIHNCYSFCINILNNIWIRMFFVIWLSKCFDMFWTECPFPLNYLCNLSKINCPCVCGSVTGLFLFH